MKSNYQQQGASFVIGISGGSGSGKTSFINALRSAFTHDELCILSQDDYYKKREEQATDANQIKNFDLPTAIRSEQLLLDLRQLLSGEAVQIMEYTFNNALSESRALTINPAPVIVVEGLFIYHFDQIKSLFDLKLYIDADDEIKLSRRINRDLTERNYPEDDVRYRYEHHVLPSYLQYINPYKKECQIIVNNNEDYALALDIISHYIKYRLKQS